MPRKPDLREPLILTALLLTYSNGLTWLAYRRGHDPERTYLFANPALLLAMLLYASKRPGNLPAVGLTQTSLPTSVLLGLGAGGLLSIVPLVFFHNPILLDTPLEYGPVAKMTRRELREDIVLRVSVNIAFMEELAFRGLLYDSFRARFSDRAAMIGSAAAFALWHFAVTYATTQQTNMAETARLPRFLQSFIQPIAVLGGMLTTGIAGLAFAYLRKRTGNLAAPIAAHWLADSLMIASLWRSSQRRKRET
jgi:membrane protease YdiL (CAAX protease family)